MENPHIAPVALHVLKKIMALPKFETKYHVKMINEIIKNWLKRDGGVVYNLGLEMDYKARIAIERKDGLPILYCTISDSRNRSCEISDDLIWMKDLPSTVLHAFPAQVAAGSLKVSDIVSFLSDDTRKIEDVHIDPDRQKAWFYVSCDGKKEIETWQDWKSFKKQHRW